MATISHESRPQRSGWLSRIAVEEMWAALAIAVMWLVVLFDAIFGPSIESVSDGNSTSVPSAVIVAFFAFLGTWVVARRAFGRH